MSDSLRQDPKSDRKGGASPKDDRRAVAVAIKDPTGTGDASKARVEAAGYGYVAKEILDLAFASGVKVREDAGLAEILAALQIETPIPTEAIMAVADILARVYEANEAAAGAQPSSETPGEL